MSVETINVPDIGTDEAAEVVEVCVAVGDLIEAEQSIIVLETDKASVEVPSSGAGKVTKLLVKEGDQIKTGAPILEIERKGAVDSQKDDSVQETADSQEIDSVQSEKKKPEKEKQENTKEEKTEPKQQASKEIKVPVPDLGGAGDVDVIEVCVNVGDEVEEGDSLIVLETDKASLDVPSPAGGKVISITVKEGGKVKEGDIILVLQTSGGDGAVSQETATKEIKQSSEKQTTTDSKPSPATAPASQSTLENNAHLLPTDGGSKSYAGPSVRKLARQLGVDLSKVKATGPRDRCTKEDIRLYVREFISGKSGGSAIPQVPAVDFSQFGDIKKVKLSKIKKLTAANMHRSWLNVPHVTQFDDADITALDEFRKSQKDEAQKRGVKLTPVPLLIKACALTLRAEPSFNVSLDPDGEHIIEKDYVHIGMAVDTPAGLVVPVMRDVDKKDIWEIAAEVAEMAAKARDGKLTPKEMKGGCFTISSLGNIGGQGFTPIVNTPEVGILGVSKASIKPFWDGKKFVPHNFLPVSLSYDHRAVNGADAGKFLTHLVGLLEDYEKLL